MLLVGFFSFLSIFHCCAVDFNLSSTITAILVFKEILTLVVGLLVVSIITDVMYKQLKKEHNEHTTLLIKLLYAVVLTLEVELGLFFLNVYDFDIGYGFVIPVLFLLSYIMFGLIKDRKKQSLFLCALIIVFLIAYYVVGEWNFIIIFYCGYIAFMSLAYSVKESKKKMLAFMLAFCILGGYFGYNAGYEKAYNQAVASQKAKQAAEEYKNFNIQKG